MLKSIAYTALTPLTKKKHVTESLYRYIYNRTIEVCYKNAIIPIESCDKTISIFKNILHNTYIQLKSDDSLIKKIQKDSFVKKSLFTKSPIVYSPSRFEDVIEDIKKRTNSKVVKKISNLYKCRKCNKRECIIESIQAKSLDESETTIVQCQTPDCNNIWHMN